MKVIAHSGREDIAVVYILEMQNGKLIECVESIQPPVPRQEKWVLLITTMFGCPVKCLMCDAGGDYKGKLSAQEIFDQIDFLVSQRYENRIIPCKQFKIQFARMGEPALNAEVLRVLEELPDRYQAPGLLPSVSTIGPHGTDHFFSELIDIKNRLYGGGRFQLQFSIHTTDKSLRDELIPVRKWSFAQIASFGDSYHTSGDLKITLNFALAKGKPVDPEVLLKYFDPDKFLIKITPLNPTYRARETQLSSYIESDQTKADYAIVQNLMQAGYQVILSIGVLEENLIGSNCGQYIRKHLEGSHMLQHGYTYDVMHEPIDLPSD